MEESRNGSPVNKNINRNTDRTVIHINYIYIPSYFFSKLKPISIKSSFFYISYNVDKI